MIQISQPQIGNEEVKAAEEVLLSGRLAQGPKVQEFEERFATYVGARHGVAVGNGTQALHLALLARNVRPGDRVVTTPFTFAATATSILMCGATPVFVDVDEDGMVCIHRLVVAMADNHAKLMLPVHLYGSPVLIDMRIGKHPLVIDARVDLAIFDACQAHGASYGVHPVGWVGTSCWSFYATKNMTTGEGGMITTNDEGEADRLRALRNHGQGGQYEYLGLGYNYRMTEVQAAIGLVQLDKLPTMQAKRHYNASYFTQHLQDLDDAGAIVLPRVRPDVTHAWHQYTIRLPWNQERTTPRDLLLMYLRSEGIGARVYYPAPLHQTPLFQNLGYDQQSLPMAERLSKEVLSLPVHPGLSDDDLTKIVECVRKWVEARQ